MPAFNFMKQFAPAVEDGTKRQTIRALRKDGRAIARVGDPLMLYTGMRTKACRKLRDATCKHVTVVVIDRYGDEPCVFVKGVMVMNDEEFAEADGFESAAKFFEYFEKAHGFPFHGELCEW